MRNDLVCDAAGFAAEPDCVELDAAVEAAHLAFLGRRYASVAYRRISTYTGTFAARLARTRRWLMFAFQLLCGRVGVDEHSGQIGA